MRDQPGFPPTPSLRLLFRELRWRPDAGRQRRGRFQRVTAALPKRQLASRYLSAKTFSGTQSICRAWGPCVVRNGELGAEVHRICRSGG